MDLYDAVTHHQLALGAASASAKTARLYRGYEERFLEYLKAKKIAPTLDALNAVNVRQAVLWFQQRGQGKRGGESATAMFLRTLKTWANFLEQEGVYADSPLRKVRQMRVRKLERQPYTRQEINALLHATTESAMPERDRLLVELLLRTGCRISEATGLHVQDVDLHRGQVRLLGKGNKERTVPIRKASEPDGGPIPRAYRAWLKVRERIAARNPERSGDRLFLTRAGYPLTGEGGTEAFKRLGALAGVEEAIPHRCRHSFATAWLTKWPGDEAGLRRMLGQVSKDVMANYIHLSQATLSERVGQIDPMDDWLSRREGA